MKVSMRQLLKGRNELRREGVVNVVGNCGG